MRIILAIVLVAHALIHFAGTAKAFGWGTFPALTPISKPMGLGWLVGGIALLASVAVMGTRWFWVSGLVALVVSQGLILGAWRDAKFGTLANVLLLLAVGYGFAHLGPWSLPAEFRRASREVLAQAAPTSIVTEAELVSLPAPVQRYLRFTESIGQPRIRNFRAFFTGRLRGGRDEPWMNATIEQVSSWGATPARLFLIDAVMKGLPVDVLHRFTDADATFRVRLLSLVTMVNARGPELTRAETVTIFNDLCFLAPTSLLDPSVRFEPIDDRSVRAFFTRGQQTVSAELRFDDRGALIDFVSDDRLRASSDGTRFTPMRWSTPFVDYQRFGTRTLAANGEARWAEPAGAFTYAEFRLERIDFNVAE